MTDYSGDLTTTHGWRFWILEQDRGTLLAPFMIVRNQVRNEPFPYLHAEALGPVIDAYCEHGNEPPSPRCSCGVHYMTSVRSFVRNDPRLSGTFTLGTIEGPVLPDATDWVKPEGGESLRCARYTIAGVLCPMGTPRTVVNVLANRYECPVLPIGVTPNGVKKLTAAVNAAIVG